MKKEFKLIVKSNKDGLSVKTTNVGFNALELLGILDMKCQDIRDQFKHPEDFKYIRETETEDGKLQKVHVSEEEVMRELSTNPVQNAYNALEPVFNKKRVTKSEILVALEEAVGFLGEALED